MSLGKHPNVALAALTIFAIAVSLVGSRAPARAAYSLVEMRAQQRAAGNRREDAVRIGRTLFRTVWPAQVRKVRVDGVGAHRVAGVVLSGTNFHSKLAPAAFVDEVVAIVTQTFAASDVEEVDAWAILPLPTYANEVVAGDLAQPTSYTVFSATVRRGELSRFAERIRSGTDVYWDAAWRRSLERS